MSIRLVGELLTPISCPMAGVTIHLKALDTSASVLFSSEASVKTDYRGRYEFTVPTGLYLVSLDNGISQAELGQIQVYSDSTESTLQALLDAPKTEPSPIWLQQLEEKVAEATRQAGIATNAASEATTAAKTVKDNVDAAKQHADRAYASATNAGKSEASASADAVSAEESAVRAEEAAAISKSLGVVNPNLFINGCFSENQRYPTSGTKTEWPRSLYYADRWKIDGANTSGGSVSVEWHSNNNGSYIRVNTSGCSQRASVYQRIEMAGLMPRDFSGRDITVQTDYISQYVGVMQVTALFFSIQTGAVLAGTSLTKSEFKPITSSSEIKNIAFTLKTPSISNLSVPVSDVGLQIAFNFSKSETDLESPDGNFAMLQAKAEWGDTATPNVPDLTSINLAKCHRYYNIATSRGHLTAYYARSGFFPTCYFPEMRTIPATNVVQSEFRIGGGPPLVVDVQANSSGVTYASFLAIPKSGQPDFNTTQGGYGSLTVALDAEI